VKVGVGFRYPDDLDSEGDFGFVDGFEELDCTGYDLLFGGPLECGSGVFESCVGY
jgi:hypothetical protein